MFDTYSRRPSRTRSFHGAGGWIATALYIALIVVLSGVASAWTSARRDDDARSANFPESVDGKPSKANPLEPTWLTDFDKARKLAVEQRKPMLLRFTADWCPPCQVMSRSVFPKPDVKKALIESVVPVVLDVDDEQNEVLAWRYKVVGVPTMILVDADGRVLDRGGFMSAEELVRFLGKP